MCCCNTYFKLECKVHCVIPKLIQIETYIKENSTFNSIKIKLNTYYKNTRCFINTSPYDNLRILVTKCDYLT